MLLQMLTRRHKRITSLRICLPLLLVRPLPATPQYPDRCAWESSVRPELLVHVPAIWLRKEFRVIHEENKCGWTNSSLQENKVYFISEERRQKKSSEK
jgi:hypothetical protein